ncbi:uncharacterized protein JCM15063_003929 [Sporobolomyces koalae]|uniref:uncharacterized protein n=1 Tax=Sporobolomyces koalae TaxID=500713 RepID=UPI00317C9100
MFAQNNTNSPYRSSQPSQGFGTPQGSSFAQQTLHQQAPFGQSTYPNASHGGHSGFAGPQFGGGNSHFAAGGAGASGYGSQFGSGSTGPTGAGYGSPFAQNSMQGSMNQGHPGTPNFGEGKKRNYLPGYLSGGAAAQPESTPPQAMHSDSWDSPARKPSLSTSPGVARYGGGGSLFGASRAESTPVKSPKFAPYAASPRNPAYRNEMEEDAPPTASLNEFDSVDSSHHAENSAAGSRSQSDHLALSPFSASVSALPPVPSSSSTSSSSSTTYPVNVFGFPSSALELVLDYFSQFGEIVSKTPSQEGGNWVTIVYAQPWSAARAARKNGEILGGVLMVGVKALDEDGLRRALASGEPNGDNSQHVPSHQPGTSTPRVGGGGGGSTIGRPVQVFGPGSAFKAAPTPTKKGFLGLGGGTNVGPQRTNEGGHDAHASLFAEKSKQATMQQNQGQKGMLGKVSDLVFGW